MERPLIYGIFKPTDYWFAFLPWLFVTLPLYSSTTTSWCQPVLKALEMTNWLFLPWLYNVETACAVLGLTSLVWHVSLCWPCGGVLVDYGVRSRTAEVWFPGSLFREATSGREERQTASFRTLALESPLQRTEDDLLLRRHAKISKSRATHYTSNVEGCVEADRRLFLEFS